MNKLELLRRDDYQSKHSHPVSRYFESEFKINQPKSAAQLESLIEEYVRRSGGVATKVSVMGREIHDNTETSFLGIKATVKNSSWIPSSTRKGTADLIIGYKGRILYCEVKFSKSDRLSPDQQSFKRAVEVAGCPYIITRTLEEFFGQWSEFINNLKL